MFCGLTIGYGSIPKRMFSCVLEKICVFCSHSIECPIYVSVSSSWFTGLFMSFIFLLILYLVILFWKWSIEAFPANISEWSGSVHFFFLYMDHTFVSLHASWFFIEKLDILDITVWQLWKSDSSSLLGFVVACLFSDFFELFSKSEFFVVCVQLVIWQIPLSMPGMPPPLPPFPIFTGRLCVHVEYTFNIQPDNLQLLFFSLCFLPSMEHEGQPEVRTQDLLRSFWACA